MSWLGVLSAMIALDEALAGSDAEAQRRAREELAAQLTPAHNPNDPPSAYALAFEEFGARYGRPPLGCERDGVAPFVECPACRRQLPIDERERDDVEAATACEHCRQAAPRTAEVVGRVAIVVQPLILILCSVCRRRYTSGDPRDVGQLGCRPCVHSQMEGDADDLDVLVLPEEIAGDVVTGGEFDGRTLREVFDWYTRAMDTLGDSQSFDEEEGNRLVFSPRMRDATRILTERGVLRGMSWAAGEVPGVLAE